jgi:predicted N-formylglutamate amidohydrolase
MSDAYTRLPAPAETRLLIICDHARNAVPPELPETLGLPAEQMQRHIAYDIGAEGVARHLAARLGAECLIANWSRIVIDPNRSTDDPTLVRKIYDGAIIPGNRHADDAEIARRRETYYTPYHEAIDSFLSEAQARGEVPLVLSIHSYTPQLIGKPPRPWHIGVLWDEIDGRLARPLIEALREDGDCVVGDNEPYAGTFPGDTMATHVYARGLPGTLVEIRNDLISEPEGQVAWADRLADAFIPLLERPETHRIFER